MKTTAANNTTEISIEDALKTAPTTGSYHHHGDIILMPIGHLREPARPAEEFGVASHLQPLFPPSAGTGHAHAMNHPEGVFISGKESDNRRQLIVTETVMLVHKEHAASVIPAGHYAIYHAREMSLAGDVHRVVD